MRIQIKKLQKFPGSWYFLASVLLVYLSAFFTNPEVFFTATNFFLEIFVEILPVFFTVFVLMAAANYWVSPELIIKHLSGRGSKKWLIVIIGGILSSGPIYLWYPLLADLRKKGMNYGLVASFLYNRAIKIPLLPIAIFYFGWAYVAVLTAAMVGASVIQGLLINRIIKKV